LGLIIVDEEHDTSFKQQDPAPRYNARDLAVYMGSHYGCKILLGTATPSLETAYNVYETKYHLTTLRKRFGNFSFPEIHIVDIGHAYKRKKMHSHFSEQLLGAIQDTIDKGQQTLLFQNRRGFAPQQECQSCGHVPQCKHCDVSLTYHKQTHKHKCHYCGYTEKPLTFCKLCKTFDVKYRGFGTEKIEDELAAIFSDKVIRRMDYDTTRQKGAYERLINAFEDREIDILVGTQMISKGLDFKYVGMVGVLNADQLLNFPDFRAFERAFQMLCQVSGRAGRKQEQSKVIIQTFQPEHDVLNFVKTNDYKSMLQAQLKERQAFRYPPFYRMIHVLVRHRSRSTVIKASDALANALRQVFEYRVLGPEFPNIERIKSMHQKQILLKLERNLSYSDSKLKLNNYINSIISMEQFKGLKIRIDVDPF
jgi:primosomal protein N' (replication factor Y)